jgi:hypothetical protein
MPADGDPVVATVRRAGASCAAAFDGRVLVEVVRHRTHGAMPEDELIARYRASELVVEDTHPNQGRGPLRRPR